MQCLLLLRGPRRHREREPAPAKAGGRRRHIGARRRQKVAAAFKDVKAAIHRNHGQLTASRHSSDSAAFWFIAFERCCWQQLMIEATGRPPVLVPPERARYSREHVGSDYIGWLHFQPIYDPVGADGEGYV
jgi:ribulose-5-phosphate 4-epimerase/fuculose-1-phosphate aldolase